MGMYFHPSRETSNQVLGKGFQAFTLLSEDN
jgi:hypothetical protein